MRCNRVTLAVVGTAVFFGLAMPARAQRIGMIAGGTFSQLRGLDNVTAKNRTGTMFGASLTLPIGGSTAFQPELLFVNKGSELKIGDVGKKDIRIDYLEIPLLLRFDHNPGSAVGPHLYLGPSMGSFIILKNSSCLCVPIKYSNPSLSVNRIASRPEV